MQSIPKVTNPLIAIFQKHVNLEHHDIFNSKGTNIYS